MAKANNREATLRLTRPLRRDVNDLKRRVRILERQLKRKQAPRQCTSRTAC